MRIEIGDRVEAFICGESVSGVIRGINPDFSTSDGYSYSVLDDEGVFHELEIDEFVVKSRSGMEMQ